MKKRLISLLLAFSMMLTFLPAGAVSAFAEENSHTYNCGENVTATLSSNNDGDGTYTMTIRGTGPMENYDFFSCRDMPWRDAIPKIKRLIVDDGVTSLGDCVLHGFDGKHDAESLEEVTLPEGLTYLGNYAFFGAAKLKSITLPGTLTTIGIGAFDGCAGLTDITIPSNVKTIKEGAFGATGLTSVTLSDNLETLGQGVFRGCPQLTSIHIPKSVKSMGAEMFGYCDALTCITFEPGSNLTYVGGSDGDWNLFTRTSPELKVYCEPGLKSKLSGRGVPDERIITTVNVTLVDGDKSEPKTIDYGANIAALGTPTKQGYSFTGWYTDEDCTKQYPDAQLFTNINGTTLYAGWEFDPNALVCHQLTVTGGTVTVKYDGSDVTSKLNSRTDATTGQKTYYVPDGAEVTVTLDKTAVPNGKVFDSWSAGEFSLPQDQNYKAENITFTMNSDVDIAAQYRDAATDHTPDTAVCHPLTVTGGIVTVKNGDKDVTDTLTVTTDEATGKKTYSVPDGATVTVTLDKTLIPEGMVFDIWSTGKFSLPLGQDYKAETITFTMSSGVDIAAQYRDATIEDDEPNVLGTVAIIGTAAVGGAVLGYQAYSLGAEFAGKLMALPYFPSNRSALAMMLWEDAGKPMPESELLYPDVEQEERDMDLQHAARWAMENELIPDLNDEGTAPEEMKFYPDNTVSKIDVLNAWQKAQELKQNA